MKLRNGMPKNPIEQTGVRNLTGWKDSPSAWKYRLPVIGVAAVGLLIASYLTLFQLGVIQTVWEPFFDNGTQRILMSSFSRSLPVPDAFIGVMGYLSDIILETVGGTHRWKATPWIVCFLGAVVGLSSFVSVILVVVQPAVYHAWCTLCLASALVSFILVRLTVREVRASMMYLQHSFHQDGNSRWKVFWGT